MLQCNPSRRIHAQQDAVTCQRVTAMIRDCLATELGPESAAALEEHLHDCPDGIAFSGAHSSSRVVMSCAWWPELSGRGAQQVWCCDH